MAYRRPSHRSPSKGKGYGGPGSRKNQKERSQAADRRREAQHRGVTSAAAQRGETSKGSQRDTQKKPVEFKPIDYNYRPPTEESWGSYKGSSISLGGGQSMHESFTGVTGKPYQAQRDSKANKWTSDKAKEYDYGFKAPAKVYDLTGKGFLADTWETLKNPFTEDLTRAEGFARYGFSNEEYQRMVPPEKRTLSERFVNTLDDLKSKPLDTMADLVDNPLVNTAMAFSGLSTIGFGIQAVDTITDMVQGEIDTTKGLGRLASTAIDVTPFGESLGAAKGLAKTALTDLSDVASYTAGTVGGRVGAKLGTATADVLGSNMYVGAALTAVGSIGLAKGSQALLARTQKTPDVQRPVKGTVTEGRQSPLLAQAQTSIEKSEALRTEAPDVTHYIDVNVPFYGTPSLYEQQQQQSQQQQPLYGLS